MSETERLLEILDGSKIPYVEVTEDAKNPYCDSCSQPIKPNRDIQLYAVDKLINGREIPSGFRVIRLHCEECRLPEMVGGCGGYNEFLIDAWVDDEWRQRNPEIVDVSGRDSGDDWNPREVMEQLFQMDYGKLMAVTGYESQGPLDALDVMLQTGVEPREILGPDGSVNVTPEARKQFSEGVEEVFKEVEAKGGIPQPPMREKLKAMWETEPAERE